MNSKLILQKLLNVLKSEDTLYYENNPIFHRDKQNSGCFYATIPFPHLHRGDQGNFIYKASYKYRAGENGFEDWYIDAYWKYGNYGTHWEPVRDYKKKKILNNYKSTVQKLNYIIQHSNQNIYDYDTFDAKEIIYVKPLGLTTNKFQPQIKWYVSHFLNLSGQKNFNVEIDNIIVTLDIDEADNIYLDDWQFDVPGYLARFNFDRHFRYGKTEHNELSTIVNPYTNPLDHTGDLLQYFSYAIFTPYINYFHNLNEFDSHPKLFCGSQDYNYRLYRPVGTP